jgi:glycine/serine hydroxymethyltransferase
MMGDKTVELLRKQDPKIAEALNLELNRQRDNHLMLVDLRSLHIRGKEADHGQRHG